MLPKVEKNKKNAEDKISLQERLVEEERKIKKKRKLVTLILVLSVGTSVGFGLYRKIKLMLTEGQKWEIEIKLPEWLEFKKKEGSKVKVDIDGEVGELLGEKMDGWQLYLKSGEWDWSKNIAGVNEEETKQGLVGKKGEVLKRVLPEGVEIWEEIREIDGEWELRAVVKVSEREILMVMKTGEKEEKVKEVFASLAKIFYWAGMQN